MTAEALSLLNGVLQTSLVFALVLACAAGAYSPRWRVLLLRAALLLALAAPIAVLSGAPKLGVLRLQPPASPVTVARIPVAAPAEAFAAPEPLAQISAPAAPGQTPSGPVAGLRLPGILPTLFGLWALGFLAIAGRYLAGLISLRRAFAEAAPAPVAAESAFRQLRQGLGASPHTQLRVSDQVAAPCTFGWLRPRVLVPPAALASPARTEAVLAHELCHVAHRDALWLGAGQLVVALHWFNPLAWACVRRHGEELEIVCDDAVTERLVTSPAYARALVEMAQALLPTRPVRLSLASGPHMASLGVAGRVRRLIEDAPRLARPSASAIALLSGAAVLALASLTFTGVGFATQPGRADPATPLPSRAAPAAELWASLDPVEPALAGEPVELDDMVGLDPVIALEPLAGTPVVIGAEATARVEAEAAAAAAGATVASAHAEAASAEAVVATEAAAGAAVSAAVEAAHAVEAIEPARAAQAMAVVRLARASTVADSASLAAIRASRVRAVVARKLGPPPPGKAHLFLSVPNEAQTVSVPRIGLACSGGGCVGEAPRGADLVLRLSPDSPPAIWTGCAPAADGRSCRISVDGESARVKVVSAD